MTEISRVADAGLSVWLQAPTRYRPTDANIETLARHFNVSADALKSELASRNVWPADHRQGEMMSLVPRALY